ncbi:MAG: hypothetical protein H6Q77_2011 [Gemmatimonadetes bacterium]|nr:hypothetical protein [Gemmatimonadota bacterium]
MPNFTVTDAVGTTRLFPGVEALLDALELGFLGGDDFVYDSAQKTWIRLKDHPAVQAGWVARQRFRPLDDRDALGRVESNPFSFPHLGDDGITPGHGIAPGGDFEARRAAWRAIRSAMPPAGPQADPYLSGERVLTRGAVAGAVALVVLICGALVLVARGMESLTR